MHIQSFTTNVSFQSQKRNYSQFNPDNKFKTTQDIYQPKREFGAPVLKPKQPSKITEAYRLLSCLKNTRDINKLDRLQKQEFLHEIDKYISIAESTQAQIEAQYAELLSIKNEFSDMQNKAQIVLDNSHPNMPGIEYFYNGFDDNGMVHFGINEKTKMPFPTTYIVQDGLMSSQYKMKYLL